MSSFRPALTSGESIEAPRATINFGWAAFPDGNGATVAAFGCRRVVGWADSFFSHLHNHQKLGKSFELSGIGSNLIPVIAGLSLKFL